MDSPFRGILHTNAVPTDAECKHIRDLLEDPRKELTKLTEEIHRLQSLIDEVSKKRDELNDFVEAHLALVSPARRLPDDVVRGIFTASLPSLGNAAFTRHESPLLLCQICSAWRSVALSTPRLWASIHIVVSDKPRLERLVDGVKSWLARSGVLPLAISMVFSLACGPDDYDIPLLLSALVSVSRRWNNVNLTLPDAGPAALGSLSTDDVPLLRSIALSSVELPWVHWNMAPDADSNKSLPFLASNTLRSIELHGSSDYLCSPVPWGNLTHLSLTRKEGPDLNSLTYDAAWAILRQCSRLETCKLAFSSSVSPFADQFSPQYSPFSLPQLTALVFDIIGHIEANVIPFFAHITFPILRSFHCTMHNYMIQGGPPLPLTCLFPSNVALESLGVDVPGFPNDIILAALSEVPSLRELRLLREPVRLTGGMSRLLKQLTPSADGPDPVLCPCLRRLELEYLRDVSDAAVVDFVRSRTCVQLQNVARLTHIRLMFQRPAELDILHVLQDVIADGLEIDLEYNIPPRMIYSPLEGTGRHVF
ncbi:hypothetical protein B0H11DRAFT_1962453 [Mycena galericulata]|nr:hypothetical protein B0H11DRAFT_1962453 [Mycena galericulata]